MSIRLFRLLKPDLLVIYVNHSLRVFSLNTFFSSIEINAVSHRFCDFVIPSIVIRLLLYLIHRIHTK